MPRLLTVALLSAAVAAGGCNRSTAASGEGAEPASDQANAPAASAPADGATGTTGRSSASRASRAPELREVTLPAGTRLPIVLDSSVGSDTSRAEEAVTAHLAQPIEVNGTAVVPAGSEVSGVVTSAVRAGRVKGRAHLAVRFDTLAPRGDHERYRIDTAAVARTAEATTKKDALEIGLPAAGGALVGGLLGGGKGALIGTAAGGGAGTAVVLSTRGKEIHLPRGAALTLRLLQPVRIKVAG